MPEPPAAVPSLDTHGMVLYCATYLRTVAHGAYLLSCVYELHGETVNCVGETNRIICARYGTRKFQNPLFILARYCSGPESSSFEK